MSAQGFDNGRSRVAGANGSRCSIMRPYQSAAASDQTSAGGKPLAPERFRRIAHRFDDPPGTRRGSIAPIEANVLILLVLDERPEPALGGQTARFNALQLYVQSFTSAPALDTCYVLPTSATSAAAAGRREAVAAHDLPIFTRSGGPPALALSPRRPRGNTVDRARPA